MVERVKSIIRTPERVFLILASVFGVVSAVTVPQLSIADENMHFLRSYTMSTGHVTGDKAGNCAFPKDVYQRAYSIYKGDYGAHYGHRIDTGTTVTEPCGTAESYSPFIYIPQSVGFAVARAVWPSTGLMILLGRLASLAFFIAVTYSVIRRTLVGKWVFVVVALFPTVIQQAASLSADSFTYVMLFIAAAYILTLTARTTALSRTQYALLLLIACGLILSKIPDVLAIVLVLFLPGRLFLYRFSRTSRLLRPFLMKAYTLAAMALFAVAALLLWQWAYGQPIVTSPVANPIPGHPWKFLPILFHTYVYMDPKQTTFGFTGLGGFGDFLLAGAVGSFASYRYWLPEILVFGCYLLLLLALLRPDGREDRLFKKSGGSLAIGSIAALGLVILGISYSLYVIWALPLLGHGAIFVAGLQGRYFTGAFVLLIPVGIWLRRYIRISMRTDGLFPAIVASTSGFLLLFAALQTLYAVHLGFFLITG